jgi:hypothetical protein
MTPVGATGCGHPSWPHRANYFGPGADCTEMASASVYTTSTSSPLFTVLSNAGSTT